MKKNIYLLSIVAICSLAIACSPTIEEEKPNYKQLQFKYEDFENFARFDRETAEILDWPFQLYPFITNEDGDICWQYYNANNTESSRFEIGYCVTFSLLSQEDAQPNFVDNYVIVEGADFTLEYANPVYIPFDDVSFLHRPTFNRNNNGSGYLYEFILPCVFYPQIPGYTPTIEILFYHLEEAKWYRTKAYELIFDEDLIDGELPTLGGKVTMKCLE